MLRWVGIVALGVVAILGVFLVFTSKAHARDYNISITREIPTSTGIAPAPSADRYYEATPRIMSRPSAGVIEAFEPAPANGCEGAGGGFRAESGRDRGRCY